MAHHKSIALGLLALSMLAGCAGDHRDQDYHRAIRPLVVQYAELANDFSNCLPTDFVKFTENIEQLRKQAILVYPPSSKNLKRFNRDFIDLLNKAKKAGFTFGTEYLDCEEEAIRTKDLDKKVDIADKWRWEARESSKGFGEAHQGLKQTMERVFEYPVGDIDLQPTISNFAKQMVE